MTNAKFRMENPKAFAGEEWRKCVQVAKWQVPGFNAEWQLPRSGGGVSSLINKTLRLVERSCLRRDREPSANPDWLPAGRTQAALKALMKTSRHTNLRNDGGFLENLLETPPKRETNPGERMYGIRSLNFSQEHLYWSLPAWLLHWAAPILAAFLLEACVLPSTTSSSQLALWNGVAFGRLQQPGHIGTYALTLYITIAMLSCFF